MGTTGRGVLESVESSRGETVTLWALGGAGFVLGYREERVYIDPYLSVPDPSRPFHRAVPVPFPPEQIRKATAVLSTHEHNDHCDPNTLRAIGANTSATFFGPETSARKAGAAGYPLERIRTLEAGQAVDVSPSFRATVYHSRDLYEEHAVMYLIGTPHGNIFHSGDTSYFGGFRKAGADAQIDVALLNFGKQIPDPERPYYMDAEAVAKAAADLKAKVVVPMHWNLWKEARDDPAKVKAALSVESPASEYRELGPGEFLEL
jgi:L-ascorbate metabolism protein UlaG (beta-lactamase superfamily)